MKTDGPPKRSGAAHGGHSLSGGQGFCVMGTLGSIFLSTLVLLAGWATLQVMVWLGQVFEVTVTELLRV